jgi:hypothetical protein
MLVYNDFKIFDINYITLYKVSIIIDNILIQFNIPYFAVYKHPFFAFNADQNPYNSGQNCYNSGQVCLLSGGAY